MKLLPLAAALPLLLSGCTLPPRSATSVPTHAAPQPVVPVVQRQLQQLWLNGDMNDTNPLPVAAIRADSDRLTLSWHGDAVELLGALARARGQVFSYAGVRLPLPVDLDVQGVTYANLLRLIAMQTAWRATLAQYPGQMVLDFMPSLPAAPGRYRKGGRR